MAEPATQSPYISSSAGSGSSEPGGRDLKGSGSHQSCADSFVSSSQPVSLFSTLQAGAEDTYLTHSGNQREANSKVTPQNMEKELIGGQKQDRDYDILELKKATMGSPSLGESLFSVGAKVDKSLGKADSPGHNFKDDTTDLNGCDQLKETASSVESKFALLTSAKDEPTRVTYPRSSPSPVAASEAVMDKESPESPFEVIADKLEFDKEFKDVLSSNSGDIGSNWVMHSERELLTDIPEDSVCEFQVKPRSAGRLPSGPGLSRQSSGTTAALEEVSKCVREMHSFTSELLNWDLIPKDPEDVVNSGVSVSPTKEASSVLAGLERGNKQGKTPTPHQPITISLHQKSMPPLKEVIGQEAGVTKSLTATAEPKTDIPWSNSVLPEATDADSSGESDDTVIEDAPLDKTTEGRNAPSNPFSSDKLEAVGDEETSELSQKGRFSPKSPEYNLGFTDDFKSTQTKTAVLGENPLAAPQHPMKSNPVHLPPKAGQEVDALFTRGASPAFPLDGVKKATHPGVVKAEDFMPFMKECKDSDSPDDPVETFSEAELNAARSEVVAPYFQQPSQATQDFEQERLTITALKEVGRKSETERQPSLPSSGRYLGQYFDIPPDPPMHSQKSALEKRPLCLEQAVDVKLAPAPSNLGIHKVPNKSSQAAPPMPPLLHTITELLAKFSVRDLIFWRDVKKTGLVFSTTLILLLSLAAFSVISVISYLILALLSVTISFRVYKSVIQAVQKSEEGHPFKAYLDLDVALSSEAFHNYVSSAMVHVNHALKAIMRLFLVEDLVDSLKLAVAMWLMTYVGAIFNGITLLILGELLVFSLPLVYEKYKTQIDHYVGIARDQIKSVVTKIQAKLPGVAKKKPE
ncbi:reticulon-3 isoform X1 [Anolis carolinensis]|uniref:reticulon-3 isoform X1 n=1 Tax=Anolis carolinensis TaxID=28377 RepID=UPI000462856D|nr:PREDICTED: reticulon-3 isoform X1 [Anolis carolinensis]|eukprot:XP_008121609.1 PREDICTED: reticulon-3 isoform X1 [Anolis carolinensis]